LKRKVPPSFGKRGAPGGSTHYLKLTAERRREGMARGGKTKYNLPYPTAKILKTTHNFVEEESKGGSLKGVRKTSQFGGESASFKANPFKGPE